MNSLAVRSNFQQKTARKTAFLSITISDQLTLSSHNSRSIPPNLENSRTSTMSRIDQTLTVNNSGSKPSNLKKYHIFGIVRKRAFTWSYPGKNFASRKCRGEGVLAKNTVFCNFPLPPQKNFKWLSIGQF